MRASSLPLDKEGDLLSLRVGLKLLASAQRTHSPIFVGAIGVERGDRLRAVARHVHLLAEPLEQNPPNDLLVEAVIDDQDAALRQRRQLPVASRIVRVEVDRRSWPARDLAVRWIGHATGRRAERPPAGAARHPRGR